MFDTSALLEEDHVEPADDTEERRRGVFPGSILPPGYEPVSAEVGNNGRTYVIAKRYV